LWLLPGKQILIPPVETWKKMDNAPIVLFCFNRPVHTLKTLLALKENDLAGESELFIYCDGPKENASEENLNAIKEVRRIARSDKWCGKVTILESERNRGLANSVITGVTEIVNRFGRVIVLEDDLITSRYFLRFMNDGLLKYEDESNVISVAGYLYPVKKRMPETFFIKATPCWGWATWKRAWQLFNPDAKKLLNEIVDRDLTHEFDFYGTNHYTQMLRELTEGKLDSWALRWYASIFLADKLTLLPGVSLVENIGMDNSGTHGDSTNNYKVDLSSRRIELKSIKVQERVKNRKTISGFFKSTRPQKQNGFKIYFNYATQKLRKIFS
jgi:hypothetical protein